MTRKQEIARILKAYPTLVQLRMAQGLAEQRRDLAVQAAMQVEAQRVDVVKQLETLAREVYWLEQRKKDAA